MAVWNRAGHAGPISGRTTLQSAPSRIFIGCRLIGITCPTGSPNGTALAEPLPEAGGGRILGMARRGDDDPHAHRGRPISTAESGAAPPVADLALRAACVSVHGVGRLAYLRLRGHGVARTQLLRAPATPGRAKAAALSRRDRRPGNVTAVRHGRFGEDPLPALPS